MPALKSPQQEKFCQTILKGGTQSDAYRAAYPKSMKWKESSVYSNSSTMMADAKVIQRIAELRAPVIAKVQLTREWVLNQLIEVVEMAKTLDPIISKDGETSGDVKQNLAAANKALELLGKEQGMFVDRKEIRTGALDDIPHEELEKLNAAIKQVYGVGADVVTANAGSTRH